jgi:hypothetical protein
MCTPILRAGTACITGLSTSGCAVCVGASGLLTAYTAGGGGGIVVAGTGTGSALRCGNSNTANGNYSVAFGICNNATGGSSTISGGYGNTISGGYGFIAGGFLNCITACLTDFSTVGGGRKNCHCNNSSYSTISGGYFNTSSSCYTFIGGGLDNLAKEQFSVIGGGCVNKACGSSSFIGGGNNNRTFSFGGVVAGGVNNLNCGNSSIIGAGQGNTISSKYSGILAGCGNTINTGDCSFIVGWGLTSSAGGTTYVRALSKTSGTFRIDHPDPSKNATKYLQHSFVESPTRGDNIYRYKICTINCQASLALPDYYKFLNENDQVWVSPVCHFGSAYGVIDSCQTCVTFTSNCDGEYNVLIMGTRKDIDAKGGWLGVEIWK